LTDPLLGICHLRPVGQEREQLALQGLHLDKRHGSFLGSYNQAVERLQSMWSSFEPSASVITPYG
jgi:hypothetical protein